MSPRSTGCAPGRGTGRAEGSSLTLARRGLIATVASYSHVFDFRNQPDAEIAALPEA